MSHNAKAVRQSGSKSMHFLGSSLQCLFRNIKIILSRASSHKLESTKCEVCDGEYGFACNLSHPISFDRTASNWCMGYQ